MYICNMKHARINNIPSNPKEIMDYALSKSYNNWIDEKGTLDNPSLWKREPSNLTYEEAYEIIQNNKPHWVISFRNNSVFGSEIDFWEFGGCNIGDNPYGEIFIWIQVEVPIAIEIFNKFGLTIDFY